MSSSYRRMKWCGKCTWKHLVPFVLFPALIIQAYTNNLSISYRTMRVTLLLFLHWAIVQSYWQLCHQDVAKSSWVVCFFTLLSLLHECNHSRWFPKLYHERDQNAAEWVKGTPLVSAELTLWGLDLFSTSVQDYPVASLCQKTHQRVAYKGEERVSLGEMGCWLFCHALILHEALLI